MDGCGSLFSSDHVRYFLLSGVFGRLALHNTLVRYSGLLRKHIKYWVCVVKIIYCVHMRRSFILWGADVV